MQTCIFYTRVPFNIMRFAISQSLQRLVHTLCPGFHCWRFYFLEIGSFEHTGQRFLETVLKSACLKVYLLDFNLLSSWNMGSNLYQNWILSVMEHF